MSKLDFRTLTPAELAEIADQYLSEEDAKVSLGALFLENVMKNKGEELFRAATTPIPPLSVVTDAELDERPDPEWWIEGLVQKDSDFILGGPPGLGKSFLMFDAMRRCAFGMLFYGLATQRASTLYVAGEGAGAFGLRKRAWEAAHRASVPLSADPAGRIDYVDAGVNLSIEATVQNLTEVFTAGDYDLIVLDTWSTLSGVGEENNNSENARLMDAVKTLRRTKPGAASITVHHTDAKGLKLRGATSLLGNADSVAMLKPEGKGFLLTTERASGGKQKDHKPITMHGFSLVDAPGGIPSAVVSYTGKAAVSEWWEPVRALLADGEWHTGSDLRSVCGITEARGTDYDSLKRDLLTWSMPDGALLKDASVQTRPKYKLRAVL